MPSYPYKTTGIVRPPPTVNELDSDARAANIRSNHKASKVLGVTITRAPCLAMDRKASQVVGTPVIRSDWDSFACKPSVSEILHGADDTPTKKKATLSKPKWLNFDSTGGGSGRFRSKDSKSSSSQRGQKVILAGIPPSSPTQRGRQYTVSYGSNVELMLPESNVKEWPNSVHHPSYRDRFYGARNIPSSPTDNSVYSLTPPTPVTPLDPDEQRKRRMIKSATKSAQILGNEVSNVIKNKMERLNRSGWDDD